MDVFNTFLACFLPLFVAMDVYGIVPLFLNLTDGRPEEERKILVTQATLTAFGIAVIFLISGKLLFKFLGISEADFRIAGGILLLVFAIHDLLFSQESRQRRRTTAGTLGVVPIGIPLIMGPAALTTILILLDAYGPFWTCFSLLINLVIVWMTFRHSHLVIRFIGYSGSKAVAKVASLFLAAIGVMMIRVGVSMIHNGAASL